MSKWTPGMPSPNPSGRPRGIVDKRMRLNQAIQSEIESVIEVVKARAQEGDMSAAALLLARAVPTLKAESGDRVHFQFDAAKPLADQLAAVTQAVADGDLTLEQGKQFAELAISLARARALEGGSDNETAIINALREFAQTARV